MTVGAAMRTALVDFYHQSWRLLALNALLSLLVLAVVAGALVAPALLVLLVLAGPLAAALMHCTVTVAQTEELRLAEAARGLRLHWRRGLALAALAAVVVLPGVLALRAYADSGPFAWPLTALVFYLLILFGVLQLHVWPRAVFERERPIQAVVREAAVALVRRPGASIALAFALFAVNAAGVAAAVVPFLTLTVAYSFLAAAHFALPRSPLREGTHG